MIERGIVSEVNGKTARVIFKSKDDVVSAKLPVAEHVSSSLAVGDTVVVAMWNEHEGAVIARIEGE